MDSEEDEEDGKDEVQYCTVCPRSSDPFYIVRYNKKWVITSWTDGMCLQ